MFNTDNKKKKALTDLPLATVETLNLRSSSINTSFLKNGDFCQKKVPQKK